MAEPLTRAFSLTRKIRACRIVRASGEMSVYVQISTRHQARHLVNNNIADFIDRATRKIFKMMGIPVQAYCILPDKLHLLLKCDDQDKLHTAIYRFTKMTGLISLRRFKIHLWQWKYEKEFLFSKEEIESRSLSIISLPEKTGLMEEQEHYPFKGAVSS